MTLIIPQGNKKFRKTSSQKLSMRKKAQEPLGDVWKLETPEEDLASDELSNICNHALGGDKEAQKFLVDLWDGESWERIKAKLEAEGSTWYVWWMDGVHEFMRR